MDHFAEILWGQVQQIGVVLDLSFGRDNICKITAKYDGKSFKHSFSGNITGANSNVLKLERGIYFTVHQGRALGSPWDKTGMSWTFNPVNDTYQYKCGEIPGGSHFVKHHLGKLNKADSRNQPYFLVSGVLFLSKDCDKRSIHN